MDFSLFASQGTIAIGDDGMNLEQRPRPPVKAGKALESQATHERLGLIERDLLSPGGAHQLVSGCVLGWEVIPANIQTTGKGLCHQFMRSSMSRATRRCRFDSPSARSS